MLRTAVLCLSVLQIVSSQQNSSNCQFENTSDLKNPLICCPIPEVFKKEEYKECGLKYVFDHDEELEEFDSMDDYCDRLKCLLNKHNLMKDDTNVDIEAVGEFMDKWADTNKNFREAVKIAKDKCLREDMSKVFEEGFDLCQPNIFVYCTSITIYSNCPIWQDQEICEEIKDFIDECIPFFP